MEPKTLEIQESISPEPQQEQTDSEVEKVSSQIDQSIWKRSEIEQFFNELQNYQTCEIRLKCSKRQSKVYKITNDIISIQCIHSRTYKCKFRYFFKRKNSEEYIFEANLSCPQHNQHKGKIKRNSKNQYITVALVQLKKHKELIFSIVKDFYLQNKQFPKPSVVRTKLGPIYYQLEQMQQEKNHVTMLKKKLDNIIKTARQKLSQNSQTEFRFEDQKLKNQESNDDDLSSISIDDDSDESNNNNINQEKEKNFGQFNQQNQHLLYQQQQQQQQYYQQQLNNKQPDNMNQGYVNNNQFMRNNINNNYMNNFHNKQSNYQLQYNQEYFKNMDYQQQQFKNQQNLVYGVQQQPIQNMKPIVQPKQFNNYQQQNYYQQQLKPSYQQQVINNNINAKVKIESVKIEENEDQSKETNHVCEKEFSSNSLQDLKQQLQNLKN